MNSATGRCPSGAAGLAAALLLGGCAAGDGAEGGIEYVPAAEVPRLASVPLSGSDVGLVRDFDLAGDTLYLLDRTGRVIIVERAEDGWAIAGSFGRAGGGPGEFLTPTGISADAAEVVVVDNSRLQHFTRGGELLTFRPLELPCPMSFASVAHARSGIFIHGGCARGGFAADTLKAVLAWSADTTRWQIVAEDLRYTRDGRAGHIFAAMNALTTSATGHHLFGSGARNCIWMIDDTIVPPTASSACSVVTRLYSAEPPPGVRERLRSGAIRGTNLDWPATLPVYVEHLASAAGTVLIRPFMADSVVLQRAAPDELDVAVAPLDGFVGCRAAGCLWILEDVGAVRLIVLDHERLSRLPGMAYRPQASR